MRRRNNGCFNYRCITHWQDGSCTKIAQKVPELDENKAYFEEKMGCSIYDVLPDIGKTTLLCPLPWKPKQNRIGEDSI